jgi:DNA-binding PadR family transcriptional regulator
VKSSWGVTSNNRRARYYEITAAGRKQLAVEHATWARAAAAIDGIMRATLAPEGGEP